MPQSGQGAGAQRHGQRPLLDAAGPAPQDPLHHIQHRLLRVRISAVGTAVRQRLIARQTEQLELKGGFHQRRWLSQRRQRVQAVQKVPQQLGRRRVLRRDGLRQLREVEPQRHGVQVLPQTIEQLQGGALVGVVPVALLIQRPLGVGQGLGTGGVLAALPAGAPGDHRYFAAFIG